jgi:hypothetical protein
MPAHGGALATRLGALTHSTPPVQNVSASPFVIRNMHIVSWTREANNESSYIRFQADGPGDWGFFFFFVSGPCSSGRVLHATHLQGIPELKSEPQSFLSFLQFQARLVIHRGFLLMFAADPTLE